MIYLNTDEREAAYFTEVSPWVPVADWQKTALEVAIAWRFV